MPTEADCDLYEVLGVARDATGREIRRAYRRLARQHHPDLNPHPDGPRRFAAAAHAYEILRDPLQRARYDNRRASHSPRSAVVDRAPPADPVLDGRWPAVQRGILELSPNEAVYLARHPLVLHDARGETIVLPAGIRHGERIAVLRDGHPAVLTVWMQGNT